jgi:hypothetical protein
VFHQNPEGFGTPVVKSRQNIKSVHKYFSSKNMSAAIEEHFAQSLRSV